MSVAETELPLWDTDLDFAGQVRLPREHKRLRVATSLTRKVELMERWVIRGVPPGALVPVDLTKFRAWKDERAGLWPWSEKRLDSANGPYGQLMARYATALARLREGPRQKSTRQSERIDELEREVEALELQVINLIEQNVLLQKYLGKPPLTRG